MENHTGSWRLFGGIEGHPSTHYLTLVDTNYGDNKYLIENNSYKDSSI